MTTINKIVKMWVKCGNSLPELVYHLGDGDFEVIEESGVFNDEELQYLCDNHSYPDEKLFAKVFVEEFGTINIPEEIFNCVKEAHEKEYTTEGFCIDCYYENCFDYDFYFAVNKWLKDNGDRDNGFLISQLYAQCVLKNI